MKKEYECLLCGELLKENKKGVMTSKTTGESLRIYSCDECEQSFVCHEGHIKAIPFRPDGKPIKHICQYCGKEEHFDQDVVFLFNVPTMDVYCLECGIEVLRNWLRKNPKADVEKVTKENLEEVSQLYEVVEANKFFSDPANNEKMAKMKEIFDKKFKDITDGKKM